MAAPFLRFFRRWIYGENCQRVLAELGSRFWQELSPNAGRQTFVRYTAKKELGTTKPVHVAGSDPRSPKGFWRDTNAKNGVAPGHEMFFAAFDLGFLTTARRRFSRLWLVRL